MNTEKHEPKSDPNPIAYPCLMVDHDHNAVIYANAYGVGIVLRAGTLRMVHNGDIIAYGQSRFAHQFTDFIPAPVGFTFTIQNCDW